METANLAASDDGEILDMLVHYLCLPLHPNDIVQLPLPQVFEPAPPEQLQLQLQVPYLRATITRSVCFLIRCK